MCYTVWIVGKSCLLKGQCFGNYGNDGSLLSKCIGDDALKVMGYKGSKKRGILGPSGTFLKVIKEVILH